MYAAVQFCSPWSPACQRLGSTWEEVARSLSPAGLTVAELDCVQWPATCAAQAVTSFPTIGFFRAGARLLLLHHSETDRTQLYYVQQNTAHICAACVRLWPP